jgi:hypothetical protein
MAESHGGMPSFESGRVVLLTGELEALQVNLTGKKIDVDLEDKAFIKRIIKMRGELIPKNPTAAKSIKQKSSSPLAILKTVAETLKSTGITLTVSYKGHRIATLGAEAKPTLLQIITKTKAVSLNDIFSAIRMLI